MKKHSIVIQTIVDYLTTSQKTAIDNFRHECIIKGIGRQFKSFEIRQSDNGGTDILISAVTYPSHAPRCTYLHCLRVGPNGGFTTMNGNTALKGEAAFHFAANGRILS